MQRVDVVDSHTGGEPTRVVLAGGPDLGGGSVAEQLEIFRSRYDRFRKAVVNEPRGSDVLVGALLTPPSDPTCDFGVIFFNNVGYLGMCGHGTIGLVATLAFLNRIEAGVYHLETSVGVVRVELSPSGEVSLDNVPSYRKAKDVSVEVPGIGKVVGDVAWGGNWFFLVSEHGQKLELKRVDGLVDYAWKVRQAVNAQGYPEVDHVELFGPPHSKKAQSRNFVLCPGKAYDRSPCGTGLSAKIACLAADGKLAEDERWQQESILGSTFTASYRLAGDQIVPTIRGRAFTTAQTTLLLDENDPFCWGIG
jgi:4-hydroxyproline epimerase